MLNSEILKTLSFSRARDRRFDLGIAGLPFVNPSQAIRALEERKKSLSENAMFVGKKFKLDGGDKLDFHTKEVFRRALFFINGEIKFTESLITGLRAKMKRK